MSLRTRFTGAAAVLALHLSCSGRHDAGNGTDAGPDPVVDPIVSFDASPAALHPGATVALHPVFTRGSGRVEPDIGPVVSGGSYPVGPHTSAHTYTLVVTDGAVEHRRALALPFTYANAIRPIAPSPLARLDHAVVVLPGGKALVAGGRSPGPVGWVETELFDPATGAFTPSGELLVTRWNTQALRLPGGDVLLVGGETNSALSLEARAVQRWEASSGKWTIPGRLLERRSGHTATLLPGGKILVAGGLLARAELFDPDTGESRAPAGAMVHPRYGHSATLLADGRVLLAGGWDAFVAAGAVLEAELFDPATERFTPAGLLPAERGTHVAERLPDGRVLLAGGDSAVGVTPTAEIWDPASGAFTPTGALAAGRALARSVRLADGRVLVAGGVAVDGTTLAEVEVFDPATGRWTTHASLPSPRTGVGFATLLDGRVLFTGGTTGDEFPVAAAELYE